MTTEQRGANSNLSRREFLKVLAVSIGGLTLIGVPGCGDPEPSRLVNLEKLGIDAIKSSLQEFEQLVLRPSFVTSSITPLDPIDANVGHYYEKEIGMSLTGKTDYDPFLNNKTLEQIEDNPIKPKDSPIFQVNHEVIFDEKGGQRLGRFIYGIANVDLSGSLGIGEIDTENEMEIQQRRVLLGQMKQVTETVVVLPSDMKWLPGLYLDNLQGFGYYPDGRALNIYAFSHKGGQGIAIRVYDQTIYKTFKSYDETISDALNVVDERNRLRAEQGKPPLPVTEDLNKIRQELGL